MEDYFHLFDSNPFEGKEVLKVQEVKNQLPEQTKRILDYEWPEWLKGFHKHQRTAIKEILAAFETENVVILDAPVGSGKTAVAEAVRVGLGIKHDVYVCSGIQLQDQFAGDFPYAKILKGRGNYPTENFPNQFPEVSAGDCTKTEAYGCGFCVSTLSCPYEIAKAEAMEAEVAVLNSTYFLYEANYAGRTSKQDLIVVDEGDTVEEVMMGFVEFKVGGKTLSQLPNSPTFPRKGSHEATILIWLEELETRLKKVKGSKDPNTGVVDLRDEESGETLTPKTFRALKGLQLKIPLIRENYENWVRDYAEDDWFTMKPVKIDELCKRFLWTHGKKFLIMSGTVISGRGMAEELGIDGMKVVTVPMLVPVENRPVICVPVANMARATEEEDKWKLLIGIKTVLDLHPNENVLIHSGKYSLTDFIYRGLSNTYPNVISYSNSLDRDGAVERFKRDGGVLIGPSLGRGIDLKGDLCRVVIVVKIPFPYLGDPQISRRMYLPGGETWYSVKTIRDLVQMCGRAVRGIDDWAVTYILDSNFKKVWKQRQFLPGYFIDGVGEGLNCEIGKRYRKVVG